MHSATERRANLEGERGRERREKNEKEDAGREWVDGDGRRRRSDRETFNKRSAGGGVKERGNAVISSDGECLVGLCDTEEKWGRGGLIQVKAGNNPRGRECVQYTHTFSGRTASTATTPK